MNAAYEELIHLLDEREVNYSTNDEHQSVCTDLKGEVAAYRIVAHVDAEADLFQVFGYSPIRVPEGSRPAIAEAVARANYGLRVGKFEFNVDEGDLRFQASQALTGESVGESVIDRLITHDDGHAGHVPAGFPVRNLRQRAAQGRHPVRRGRPLWPDRDGGRRAGSQRLT